MPEDMSDRVPEDMPDRMPEDLPDRMPEDMPEDMPDHMPEDMPDRMPNRMSEDMSGRMPEDLPVRKCINVMVGITRSKVIFFGWTPWRKGGSLGFSSFPSSGTHPRGESFSQPTGGCETGLRGCVHHVPWRDGGRGVERWRWWMGEFLTRKA